MALMKILVLTVFAVFNFVYCQQGSLNANSDSSQNVNLKFPLAGNDKNVLSGIGFVSGLKPNSEYGAAGGGLALDNVNGHSLSLTGSHIPKFGDQLAANAHVNLLDTPNHNLNADAFISKTIPINPQIPSYNTHGGSLDYMFRNKVGGSLGMSHTPDFQKTDYSAMGKLNLFRDRTSSLDMNAGVSRSVSPFIPKSSWQPSAGITFTRYW